jgi:RNA polymerase sigma-70 factor, ECF subfamily
MEFPSDDGDLAIRASSGDRRAFEILAGRWWGRMGAYAAAAAAGDAQIAAEAAQDALCRLYGSLPRFRGDCAFGTFVYRICRNAAVDALRRRSRERSRRADLPDESGDRALVGRFPGPEESLDANEETEALRRALAKLKEEARSLIYLKEMEGMEVSELSRIFGLPEGTVKSRLFRARAALKKILEEDGYVPY